MQRDPNELRQILLLHALEEVDALGKVIPLDVRERATKETLNQSAFLEHRSTALVRQLSEPTRHLVQWAVHPPWHRLQWLGPAAVAGAVILGWMTNELGPDRIVNILAFPLLGLILWNIIVCAIALVTEFTKHPASALPKPLANEERLRKQLENRLLQDVPEGTQREILSRGTMRFFRAWRDKTMQATAAKAKIYFHLAALALALGVVSGMYVQGLRKEYRAAWESTFLDAPALHSLLGVVLGPASVVTGIPIPSAPALDSMRLDPVHPSASKGGDAAPFIHLWAATAGIFIGLPRLLLLLLAWRRRRVPDWTTELVAIESAARNLVAAKTLVVDVLPVYYEPEPSAAEAIRQSVLQLWGGKTQVHFRPKIELGEEELALTPSEPAPNGLVLVFSFASTPEQDVQGELISTVASQGTQVFIVTDALGFESRHHALPEFEQRFAQRHSAWQRVIGPDFPWVNLTQALIKHPLAELEIQRSKFTSARH